MIIGTLRPEEARVFNSEEGEYQRADGSKFEVFWHQGGHMIEPLEGDDMPLDDWREPERAGWYWRSDGGEPHGPFGTSFAAAEDADPLEDQ